MIEYMRQEPPDDPSIAICEHCEDSGEWRDGMHECSDAAMMWCPAMGENIKVENCNAVGDERYARSKGRR
jgi:hypothetical protein